jgi:hypothetical protein
VDDNVKAGCLGCFVVALIYSAASFVALIALASGDADTSCHTGKVTATREIIEEYSDVQDDEAPELARDPDLSRIIAAWPSLTEPIKRAMLALVNG